MLCLVIDEMTSDSFSCHELLHGDHFHALLDEVEGEEVYEAVCLLMAFALVQQIHRLVWRHDEGPASSIGEDKTELHLHTDVVPSSHIYRTVDDSSYTKQ